MASIPMTASLLSSAALSGKPRTVARRTLIVAGASTSDAVKVSSNESNNGRRELMFSAAAIAVSSVVGVAMAGEPKPGTPEAKKAYGPVCVTMPTAKICHK